MIFLYVLPKHFHVVRMLWLLRTVSFVSLLSILIARINLVLNIWIYLLIAIVLEIYIVFLWLDLILNCVIWVCLQEGLRWRNCVISCLSKIFFVLVHGLSLEILWFCVWFDLKWLLLKVWVECTVYVLILIINKFYKNVSF